MLIHHTARNITHNILCNFFVQKHGRTSQSIEKLQKSKHIGRLLGNMLNKKFPKFVEEDSLTIDDILEWEYWPTFMQIYGN